MANFDNVMGETFIELCINGKINPEEIDDYIDTWHDSFDTRNLWEFLGMTEEEYNIWMLDPEYLNTILESRKR